MKFSPSHKISAFPHEARRGRTGEGAAGNFSQATGKPPTPPGVSDGMGVGFGEVCKGNLEAILKPFLPRFVILSEAKNIVFPIT